MANQLKEDEKNERIIRSLLKLPANRRCINCNSLGSQYVCTNFWTFVCTTCSEIQGQKSYENLKPDMLPALGHVSAKGHELTKSKWSSVLHQFQRMLGPFVGLSFHVILGDRDAGECSGLNAKSVNWIASSFPGLDSAGCGASEISNISFVSLNAVALLCENNDLRFSVEKVIERENVDLQMETKDIIEAINDSSKSKEASHNF